MEAGPKQFGLAIPVGMAIAVLSSCTDYAPVALTPIELPAIADKVTPDIAGALDRDGRFLAEALHPQLAADEITSGRAKELAVAFIRTHGSGVRTLLAQDHGAPVDVQALTPCGRIYYAESPYAPLDDHIPAQYHRAFGDWWLVTFCGRGGVRQASVAVSTRTTVYIDDQGRALNRPFGASFNFKLLGVPKALGALPPEPENAVAAISDLTARRVAGVPRLLALGGRYSPQWARWSVPLNSPVSMTAASSDGSSRKSLLSEVFHGVYYSRTEASSFTPTEHQPEGTPFTWTPIQDGKLLRDQRQPALARRDPNKPMAFDRITPGGS
jgi:hypothetical protein